jgi:hypothetical protein
MAKRILQMNSSKHCFAELASGRRREEIRPCSPFWHSRLEGREYDEIHFRNGYGKDAPFMRVEFGEVELRLVEGEPCYAIRLGRVLEVRH